MRSLSTAILITLLTGCSEDVQAPPTPAWHADPLVVDNPLPDDRLLEDGAIHMRPGFHQRFLPAGGGG